MDMDVLFPVFKRTGRSPGKYRAGFIDRSACLKIDYLPGRTFLPV